MIQHPHQRVGVFIDVQNMYYTAKKMWNAKVDFGNILESAVADRQLIRAIAYVVEATGEEQPFFDALHQRGLETKMREVTVFASGAKKADWDVGMAVDAIRIGEILDVVVLVTGDGDFVELVEYLRHHGRQVEVISFKETTSAKLIEASDHYANLSDHLDRYLIRSSARSSGQSRQSGGQSHSQGQRQGQGKQTGQTKKEDKKGSAATSDGSRRQSSGGRSRGGSRQSGRSPSKKQAKSGKKQQ